MHLGSTSPETRHLADRLLAELGPLARESLDYVTSNVDAVATDPQFRELTRAGLLSTLELGLTMLSHGLPPGMAEPPTPNIAHARYAARRGMDVDEYLRIYRLSHAYFWQRAAAASGLLAYDAATQAKVVQETASFSHTYMDVISSKVTRELLAERARASREAATSRDRVLTALATGEDVDDARAERLLGISPRQHHACAVLWADAADAGLDRAVETLAASAAGAPLVAAPSEHHVVVWLPREAGAAAPAASPGLRDALAASAAGVHVAMSEVHPGVQGMRAGCEQAGRVRRVADLAAWPTPTLTSFRDIALVELLTRDPAAARAFVGAELGDLALPEGRNAELRHTVLEYLRLESAHASAAASLGIHRNTLRQRLARAEERRGAPLTARTQELYTALLLVATVGDAILPAD